MYTLEKGLSDIYVEGPTDHAVLTVYLESRGIRKKVFPIEFIDFSDLDRSGIDGLNLNSNRDKLIFLSQFLNKATIKSSVNCVIDRDFHDFIPIPLNSKLLLTDFSCLESYFFCEAVIKKLFTVGLGTFPFAPKFVLKQIEKILRPLFCLRLYRAINFPQAQLVQFEGNFSVDKTSGELRFDTIAYLEKFIAKNKLSSKEQIHKAYKELLDSLVSDTRFVIHGHDFFEILFHYTNRIKNPDNFRSENFKRAILLSMETSYFEKYELFQILES